MKKIIQIICLAIISTTATFGQNTQVKNIGKYKGIFVYGSIDLVINKGESDSFKVSSETILLDKINIRIEDSILKIGATDKLFSSYRNVQVSISKSTLRSIETSAGAYVNSKEPLVFDSLKLISETGSTIRLTLHGNYVNSYVGNGSTISLEGTCKSQEAKTVSGGIFNAYDLKSEKAIAKATTGGITKIAATENLDASVSMGGSVSYRGVPKSKKEHKVFGGSIEQVQE
jgi:hypothetical protein